MLQRNDFRIEICANGVESCMAAQQGGADRVELCAGIPEGGTTPSFGEILTARKVLTTTRLHVIIRPRGGDFLYTDMETERMIADIDIARELGADGVHLGLKDMPVAEARRILGDRFIIGGTANTFDQAWAHYEASANYIGCGPFRFTTTKKNLSPILGLDGYRSIMEMMREHGIDIPVVAIGGIEESDIPSILATGVSGIALSGVVLRAADPVLKMKQIINITQHG